MYELIDSILLPRFDRKFAAQAVLATHWRTASDEQRERFIEAFYQALLRRYADGILEFDPNKITILPFRGDESKRRTKVRTTVDLDDGSKVAVDYDLVKRGSDWLVFNVVVEGDLQHLQRHQEFSGGAGQRDQQQQSECCDCTARERGGHRLR